ncbi:hypothetical protein SJAV_04540 [Sulfurisphaera javensis]|uniref:Uncharacterized protein n=1 Tax=Sulfurisphaera javensis TaxID=2049879 RepID=A0AAT9GP15_9CREN
MEKFREILIDITLSSHIPNYRDLLFEGKKKRDLCAYYDGNYCKKFKVTNTNVPANWISNNRMNPHPIICYICPYFSIRFEEKEIVLDLFDILLYYEELRETIERELNFIENKMIGINFPLSLRRRRDDLIALLNDVSTKIKVLKELLKTFK